MQLPEARTRRPAASVKTEGLRCGISVSELMQDACLKESLLRFGDGVNLMLLYSRSQMFTIECFSTDVIKQYHFNYIIHLSLEIFRSRDSSHGVKS